MPRRDGEIDQGKTQWRLTEAQDRFIEGWSRMAGVWGISRTMAEVHALLFITGEPACTDDIMERLGISRGNASMTLRALMDWGVISRVRRRGERKDFYQAEQDVWAMFRTIARERIKREVEPLTASLREVRELTPEASRFSPEEVNALNARLDELGAFLEQLTAMSEKFAGPGGVGLRAAMTLLGRPKKKARGKRA